MVTTECQTGVKSKSLITLKQKSICCLKRCAIELTFSFITWLLKNKILNNFRPTFAIKNPVILKKYILENIDSCNPFVTGESQFL